MSRLVLAMALVAAACAPGAETARPVDPELVAVAAELCPMMWRWQLSIGSVMNEMSGAAHREPDPEARRSLYLDAFEQVRSINAALRTDIGILTPRPFVDLLREDVVNGLAMADSIIGEVESEVGVRYARVPAPTYHEIVPAIFLEFEKVIDVPKPELSSYANDDLTAAFLTVAQCQHGVKDANDGIPRYVPLG